MRTHAASSPLSGDLRRSRAFAALLADSHGRLVGHPLADAMAGPALPTWLYEAAPFCLLAHDAQADPVFIYANGAAQRLFGYSWEEFTTLASRLSAEAPDRAARRRLLAAVARDGFVADYSGVRIGKSGRRFVIEQAVVWELRDATGVRHGQAAMFDRWHEA